MWLRRVFLSVWMAATMATQAPAQVLTFDDLNGWDQDDHLAALGVFRQTCAKMTEPEWTSICRLAADAGRSQASARQFFELLFRPVQIGSEPALFTGYYEPELEGSRTRTPRFAYPLYKKPPELTEGQIWHSRGTIESGILQGRGLELVWLDDPVEVYFLQVQGSGRIRLPDGSLMRVAYAGKNGQPYRSIGKELISRGTHTIADVSAQEIKSWVRRNPAAGKELLNSNPSYVFFRSLKDFPAELGPIGAMGRPISTLRSIAVDPDFTPLGAPVWIEKDGKQPFNRLFIAQDTGGAIKGPQRADIFYGSGFQAGETAGTVKDSGRMIVLMPIDRAYAMVDQ